MSPAGAYLRNCKLCGSERVGPKYELRRLDLTVFECDECGLRFIGDDLSAEQIHDQYNREGLASYFQETQARHRRKFVPRFHELQALGIGAGARVLDIGCGSGEFPALAAGHGYSAVGIDISEPSIRLAKELHPSVEFRVADVADVARDEPGAYDAVTLWDVIEHAFEPHDLVDAAAAALRPGGLIGIGTPNGESLYDTLTALAYPTKTPLADRMLEQRFSSWHLQIWTAATLGRLVAEHGLDVVEAKRHRELTVLPSLYVAQSGYTRTAKLARLVDPLVEAGFPIRNKLTVYAVKRATRPR